MSNETDPATDGAQVSDTETPATPGPRRGYFGFADDPNAEGFGEIGNPSVGGRFLRESEIRELQKSKKGGTA